MSPPAPFFPRLHLAFRVTLSHWLLGDSDAQRCHLSDRGLGKKGDAAARLCFWTAGLLVLCLLPGTVQAGLGPENLLVVVNAESVDSRTIANHYVQLRQIPSCNVVLLKNVPQDMIASLEDFRERILKPVIAEIDGRGLMNQIKAIAYSSHFPYAVDIRPHHERLKDDNSRKVFTPTASINGLTYLFAFVLADREEYLSPTSNLYSRLPWARHFANPFSGEEKDAFDLANKAYQENDYSTAGKLFSELFEKYPTQPPLAILAARSFTAAEQLDKAMGQLNAAIAAGWASSKSLADDEALAPLSDRDDFRAIAGLSDPAAVNDRPTSLQHPVAFETARAWTANGWWTERERGGMTYLPSCMLAVTRGAGTSVEQAVQYLTRAAKADSTFPRGTFYFTSTADVRTKTRIAGIVEAMAYLRAIGKRAELVKTALPENRADVLGVTFGAANYDWSATQSKLVAGAIGDNLTSTSGAMKGTSQTVLTELLKSGAAIASGTVTEPYALQFKFPLPLIHAYYAEGFSAIESYYLSIASPYQLLIVGDPLCQPFAKPPAEIVGGQLAAVNGVESLVLKTQLPNEENLSEKDREDLLKNASPISLVEFYVDGKLIHRTAPTETYTMQLSGLAAGSHEFRTVLVGEPTVAPRKSILSWMNNDKLFPTPESTVGKTETRDGKRITQLNVKALTADSIKIMHFGDMVGKLTGDQGVIEVDVSQLGDGPVRLQAVADFRGTEIAGREFVLQ